MTIQKKVRRFHMKFIISGSISKGKRISNYWKLTRSLEIFKLSKIDDNEIDIWVEDASKLSNFQEKLRLLESQLLEIVVKLVIKVLKLFLIFYLLLPL